MLRGLYKQNVATIAPERTVREAAEAMRDLGVDDLVVVRAGRPVGTLAQRDLVVACLADGRLDPDDLVESAMNARVPWARETDGLFGALRRLRECGFERLVIVDDEGRLKGTVDARDAFELLAEEMGSLARTSKAPPYPVGASAAALTTTISISQTEALSDLRN